MKQTFRVLLSALLLGLLLTACGPSTEPSPQGPGDPAVTGGETENSSRLTPSEMTMDYSQFEILLQLMFDCPNREFLDEAFANAVKIGAGVSEPGSMAAEPGEGVERHFAPYVTQAYLPQFMANYALAGHGAFEEYGESYLESFSVQSAEDSETRKFTLQVRCQGSGAEPETLEIVGSFRQDADGLVENITFVSGYSPYIRYFFDVRERNARIHAFFELCFTCPNPSVVHAALITDGSYYAEGSFVSGSGETAEDRLKELFRDFVEEDYVGTVMREYVGSNHVIAEENGSTSTVRSIDSKNSAAQDGFTVYLLCENAAGEETEVELAGTVRWSDAGKVEMLKIHSGFDRYIRALWGENEPPYA